MSTPQFPLFALAAFGLVLGFACGDSSSDDDDGGGASTGSGSSEFSCCINGDGYDCPNKAAFDKCAGFDFAACDSACGVSDAACHQDCAMQAANATHDPSDCDPDPNASACNSGTTGSGSCTPNAIGCDTSAECCDGLTCKMDPMSGTNGTFCLE
ncbi:MAG: hypothetical protein JNL21_18650 [Myxococcales bacterium]|nr:hypothetical protein [Myxococcales bacterium]